MAESRDVINSVTNIDHLVANTSCRKLLKTMDYLEKAERFHSTNIAVQKLQPTLTLQIQCFHI